MKILKGIVIVLIVLLGGALMLSSSSEATQAVTWRFQTNQASQNSFQWEKGFQPLADAVLERTDEQLAIKLYLLGELGIDAADFVDIVGSGAVDMAEGSSSYYSESIDLCYMHDLPGLASTIDDKVKMFDIVRDRFAEILSERYNAKLLFMAPWPGTFVITRDEVPDLLDWSGLRIRASATPAQDQIIASGGDSFYMPGSELYTALEKGTIDGLITSIDWMIQMKFFEQVEYLYMLPFGIQFYFGVCNLDAFNDLPANAREALVDEGLKMEAVLIEEAKKVNEDGVRTFRENGVEVVFPSEEVLSEWQEKVQMPLWNRAYPTWSAETQALFMEIIDELDLGYRPPAS